MQKWMRSLVPNFYPRIWKLHLRLTWMLHRCEWMPHWKQSDKSRRWTGKFAYRRCTLRWSLPNNLKLLRQVIMITSFFVDSHEVQEFDPHEEACKGMEWDQHWGVNVVIIWGSIYKGEKTYYKLTELNSKLYWDDSDDQRWREEVTIVPDWREIFKTCMVHLPKLIWKEIDWKEVEQSTKNFIRYPHRIPAWKIVSSLIEGIRPSDKDSKIEAEREE